MSQTVTIRLDKPIARAKLLDEAAEQPTRQATEGERTELPESQKEGLAKVCRALQDAVNKVNQFQENLLKGHKEQIAKLSVEIARKILMRQVQEGDYKIESIVEKAVENAPTRQDMVVHLNPEDLMQYQKSQENEPNTTLTGVKLVADPSVGRAECLLETPTGTVKSFIDEHLQQIGEALKKAE
jgi:flagellar biosynthesis/type III secretory pathway protein FliH